MTQRTSVNNEIEYFIEQNGIKKYFINALDIFFVLLFVCV